MSTVKKVRAGGKKWKFTLDDLQLFFLSLPTLVWYILFCYLPMFGLIIAFKKYKVAPGKGFLWSLFYNSQWCGFENFQFLFANNKATTINMFRNTVGYNIIFIVLGVVLPVTLAIMISNLKSQKVAKVTQTAMFLPHFLSWVVVGYFVFAFLSTSSIRGSMTTVSSFSEHPEEALKLIELMNTDPWYRETARYGIEGKHYTRNDDGTVTRTELGSSNMGVQAYAQGHYTLGALEASPFPEVPTDIHQWEKTMANYANATLSAAMGFTPDLAPVETQCLAIKQIIEEYRPELYTGTSDPEVVIPEMLERMNEVGLQDVIAEIQAQLNAFLGK